jgi:hypothetical protein
MEPRTIIAKLLLLGLLTSIAAIALPPRTPSVAQTPETFNAKLRGEYGFTQTRVCVQNTAGFGADLSLLGPATSRTTIFEGLLTFDGHGSGALTATALQINHNTVVAGQPVTRTTFACTARYLVNHDGAVTMQLVGCEALNTEGSGAGFSSIASDVEFQGQLSRSSESLVLSDTGTEVESFELLETGATFKRICSRSLTAVRRR